MTFNINHIKVISRMLQSHPSKHGMKLYKEEPLWPPILCKHIQIFKTLEIENTRSQPFIAIKASTL